MRGALVTAPTIVTAGGRADHGEHGAVVDDDAPKGPGLPWKCACGATGRIHVPEEGMPLEVMTAWLKLLAKQHPPRRRRRS
jgi:hypothetical protein